MNKTVGVLGCGWLGFPLAKHLISEGYRVKGTTTSLAKLSRLQDSDIVAFQIALTEKGIVGDIKQFLSGLTTLVINVPPKLRKSPSENYTQKMEHLYSEVLKSEIENVIFVSSTSVYGDVEGEITEETTPLPNTKSGEQLLESENLFFNATDLNTTIVRFGGLIGYDRHPINFLTGRKLKNGGELINLIHQIDCIGIITKIIKENYWGRIVNGVFPNHPEKQEYYRTEAEKRDLQPPDYVNINIRLSKKYIKSKNFLYNYLVPITTH